MSVCLLQIWSFSWTMTAQFRSLSGSTVSKRAPKTSAACDWNDSNSLGTNFDVRKPIFCGTESKSSGWGSRGSTIACFTFFTAEI